MRFRDGGRVVSSRGNDRPRALAHSETAGQGGWMGKGEEGTSSTLSLALPAGARFFVTRGEEGRGAMTGELA